MMKVNLLDLETDLWEQCNLRCSQCTHNSPFFNSFDEYYKLDQFKEDIDNLNRVAHINTFRIVGGEPLLNKNLLHYVKHIRESNVTDYLTIFTNGLVLSHTNNDIFPYIDRLRISVYSNLEEKKLKLIDNNINKIKEMFPHLNIVANDISYFSYFNLAEKNTNQELVDKIYDKCYYSYEHRGFSIFKGRFYKCFATRKKYNFLKQHSKENNFEHLKDNFQDSIILKNIEKNDLENFINNKQSLEGCKWCLGTCGSQLKHSQIKPENEIPATLDNLNFEEGEKYMSNLLLSWSLKDRKLGIIDNNKFFNIKHLKDYLKQFKSKPL